MISNNQNNTNNNQTSYKINSILNPIDFIPNEN